MAYYVNYFSSGCTIVLILNSDDVILAMRQRRKTDFKGYGVNIVVPNDDRKQLMRSVFSEYPKFVFYCMLLIVPLYAIAKSIMNHDWFMMAVDILLLPVGFVHGILLLFGVVS